jgi:integrase
VSDRNASKGAERRKYGQGRIYSRGGWWYVEYWHRGEQYREATHSRERADAVNLLKLRCGESAQGRLVGPVAEKLTLGDLLDTVRADYTLNQRKSKPPLARLLAFFGDDARALDLTHDALTRYAGKRLAEGAKPATVRNELAVLGRGFTLAHQAGKLSQRPPLPTVKVQNARQGFFEPADLAAVLKHLPPYLQPLIEAAYITGWRRGELVNLRWQAVDWDAGELRLERGTTKSGEPRLFPFAFHPRLAALLHEQRERVEAMQRAGNIIVPWVFFHDDGRRVRGWYYDAWRTACRKAGLEGRIVHDFRRSAARNLVRAGVPETVAMKLTGHKTRSVFDRYNITSTADLKDAVARLARFHGGGESAESGRVLAMEGRRK